MSAGHVVVGFDGSPAATAALRWAADEARLRGVPLIAYTVTGHHNDLGNDLGDLPRRLAGGYPVTVRHHPGDAATLLCAACTPHGLLVLGTRARPAVSELVLGSVSRACLRHAPCPVVVIRDSTQLRHVRGFVTAGIRSPTGAGSILVAAAREARWRAGTLIAVHARPLGNVDAQLLHAATARLNDQGHEWLAAQLAATGVHAVPEVVVGAPENALLQHSAHAALLVLGAHQSSGLWTGQPGTTITHCIRQAPCPVMVVPNRPGHQQDADGRHQRDQ